MMRSSTSDNVFLKEAFVLPLKPLNFVFSLFIRAELVVVPLVFTASKRALSFSDFTFSGSLRNEEQRF